MVVEIAQEICEVVLKRIPKSKQAKNQQLRTDIAYFKKNDKNLHEYIIAIRRKNRVRLSDNDRFWVVYSGIVIWDIFYSTVDKLPGVTKDIIATVAEVYAEIFRKIYLTKKSLKLYWIISERKAKRYRSRLNY